MAADIFPERVCYVHCNLCNTILAVNVPSSINLVALIVTVRCGHCANLLSVNMGALLHSALQLQDNQVQQKQLQSMSSLSSSEVGLKDSTTAASSSSSNNYCNRSSFGPLHHSYHEQPKMPPIRPPEKRQRLPSAYNRFIKEEIQRIKASNPEITHREAFSTAAKNWAHLPRIHLGQKLDQAGNKQA